MVFDLPIDYIQFDESPRHVHEDLTLLYKTLVKTDNRFRQTLSYMRPPTN